MWNVGALCGATATLFAVGQPPEQGDPQTGPYRSVTSRSLVKAEAFEGRITLEVGPRHVELELGPRLKVIVSARGANVIRRTRGRERSRRLEVRPSRLWLARSHPGRAISLWHETRPGMVERLGGVTPGPLLEVDALSRWKAVDKFAARANDALAPWTGGAREATELGTGGHRVLLVRMPDRLLLYARPLFRERPRRVLEVCCDGSLVVSGKHADRRGQFHDRFGAAVSGDRLVFLDKRQAPVAALWLPWISVEDRRELARRFGELVDPSPPEPPYGADDSEAAGEVTMRWSSGLGCYGAMQSLWPSPLPRSITDRFRRW